MLGKITREQFEDSIIAQDDDDDYSQSGWVACIIDGVAYLGRYCHCSCFETFDDLCGLGIGDYCESGVPVFDWSGTPEELIELATRKADPSLPERPCRPDDYDYDHLMSVYAQILCWSKKQGEREESHVADG